MLHDSDFQDYNVASMYYFAHAPEYIFTTIVSESIKNFALNKTKSVHKYPIIQFFIKI